MFKLIFVGIGGALGAILRYELDIIIINGSGGFPWATLVVNLLGCFVIGIAYKIFYYELLHSHIQSFIITGFLGALTTFSSYSYATLMFFEKDMIYSALINLSLNNVLGILFAFIGATLTNSVIVRYIKRHS